MTHQYVVKEVALYPNSVSVPLMDNYGVRRQPKGMLEVTLHGIKGLKSTDLVTKGDPYVVFEVGVWVAGVLEGLRAFIGVPACVWVLGGGWERGGEEGCLEGKRGGGKRMGKERVLEGRCGCECSALVGLLGGFGSKEEEGRGQGVGMGKGLVGRCEQGNASQQEGAVHS